MPAKKKSAPAASSARYKTVLASQWTGNLRLGALFAEMAGTFVLTSALLVTSGSIVIAALAIMMLVMSLSGLSGAHFNPAVTLALFSIRKITALRASGYILAQLFGAMLAMVVIGYFTTTGPADPTTGGTAMLFQAPELVGDWRPFFAEMLGAIVFGLGIGAAFLGRKEGHEAGFLVGGAILIGLLLASQASAAVLNPAVAMGLSAYKFTGTNGLVTIWVYALAPILGLAVGTWLYKLMRWDVTDGKSK